SRSCARTRTTRARSRRSCSTTPKARCPKHSRSPFRRRRRARSSCSGAGTAWRSCCAAPRSPPTPVRRRPRASCARWRSSSPRPGVRSVLTAVGVKRCYRRNNRDDVHVFVLAFLLVLAAAALGGSFFFGVSFVAYVVLATWALVLFHLRREMEENYLVKHSSQ